MIKIFDFIFDSVLFTLSLTALTAATFMIVQAVFYDPSMVIHAAGLTCIGAGSSAIFLYIRQQANKG